MLEVIREHSKGWLGKLLLAAITVPFALWGIDSYLHQAGSSVAVAKVGGQSITMQEYSNALQNLRSQLQAQGKTDPAMLEDPKLKRSVLDKLIITHLLNAEVNRAKFMLSDEQLAKYITELPEFQQDGHFSQEVYDKLLAQNRLSPSQFEARIRGQLLTQEVREGVAGLAYLPNGVAEQALKVENQQREVSVAEIKTKAFVPQTKVTPEEVKAHYDKNHDKFRVPEQVKLEFVVMSANNLIPGMQVNDDEMKKFYAENASKFQGDEQRRASHILISFGVSATPQAKQEARKKAEEVLAEVKKNPKNFEALAKKYSQDPGSAEKGGDLGVFGRGAMVKPFEDAVFSMSPGAVSDLVESEFGYHIIKLTEIKGQAQTYDDVKPQIRAELMYQKSLSKFSEQAENFSNMVYEQSNSLQPAAKAFGLQVQTTGWMSRAEGVKFFKNDRLMNLVFTDEVLKERRNTEAIEVTANNLLSARVVDYKPAAPRSFSEVSAGIEEYLKLEQAATLAIQKGESDLAILRQAKEVPELEWIPSVMVDRKNAQGLTDLAMTEAFKMDASKLPAYSGVANGNEGYLLVKVSKVENVLPAEESDKQAKKIELQSALSLEYVSAYIKSLKEKAKITVNQQLLSGEPAGQ
jgi:peptidyl-prolyl cis-trans isomerase D